MFAATVARAPAAEAIRYFDGRAHLAELDARSDAFAVALAEPASRRATAWPSTCRTCPQFVIALLGTWKAGGIAVSVNPMNKAARADRPAARLRRDRAASAWSASTRDVARGVDRPGDRGHAPWSPPPSWTTRRATTSGFRRRRAARLRGHARHGRCCSSTPRPDARAGRPRGRRHRVPHLHLGHHRAAEGRDEHPRNVVFNAQTYRDWCGLGADDVVLGVAPLFHITGLIAHVTRRAAAPARRWCCSTGSSRAWRIDTIREHRPTFTVGSITVFIALMNAPNADRDALAVAAGRSAPAARRSRRPRSEAFQDDVRAVHPQHLRPDRDRRRPRTACRSARARPVDEASGALSVGRAGLQHGRADRRRRRRGAAARRGRRDRHQRAAGGARLLEQARGDRARAARRRAAHRRRRLHGRATAGSTSSTARRTRSTPAATRSGRARSRTSSTSTRPCARPRWSACPTSTAARPSRRSSA